MSDNRAQIEMTLQDKASAVLHQFKTNLVSVGTVGAAAIKKIGSAIAYVKSGFVTLGSGIKSVLSTIGSGIGWVADKLKWLGLAAAGFIGYSTAKFIEEDRELQKLKQTMLALGLEADKNSKKFFNFANQLEDSTGTADETIMNMTRQALMSGVKIDKVKDVVQKSLGLSFAMQIDPDAALKTYQMALQGNFKMLSKANPLFRNEKNQNIEAVNRLSDTGMKAQIGYMDNSAEGKILKMQTSLDGLTKSIGGVFAPLVGKAAESIKAFVDDNAQRIVNFCQTGVAYFTYFSNSIYNFFSSSDEWSEKFKATWELIKDVVKESCIGIVKMIVELGSTISSVLVDAIKKGVLGQDQNDDIGKLAYDNLTKKLKDQKRITTDDYLVMDDSSRRERNGGFDFSGGYRNTLKDVKVTQKEWTDAWDQAQKELENKRTEPLVKKLGVISNDVGSKIGASYDKHFTNNPKLSDFTNLQKDNTAQLNSSLANIAYQSQWESSLKNVQGFLDAICGMYNGINDRLNKQVSIKSKLLDLDKSTKQQLMELRGAEALQADMLLQKFQQGTKFSSLTNEQKSFITGNSAMQKVWGDQIETAFDEKWKTDKKEQKETKKIEIDASEFMKKNFIILEKIAPILQTAYNLRGLL
jgi:hypothetical protein